MIGELCWYFSGSVKANDISKYSAFWDRLKDGHSEVNSNYGYLVFYKKRNGITSYEWCLNQLKSDKDSRQAVALYNDNDYYYYGNKDYICTQLQNFLIRSGKLLSIVYLRSSDAILGLQYDIPWWSIVQQQLSLDLDIPCGEILVNIGSSHFYEDKFELVNKILSDKKEYYFVKLKKPVELGHDMTWYEENINNFIEINQVEAV